MIGSLAHARRNFRRLRAYLGRPRLQVQDRPVILDEQDYCPDPIFLLGVHRSGTSLLRRIVNAHSRITCPPETFFLLHFAAMIDDEMTFRGLSGFGLSEADAVHEIRKQASRFHEAFRRSQGKPRWADKTPQYLAVLNQLDRLFDGAKYISIIRHPLDVTASIYRRGWRFGEYSPDLFENAVLYVKSSLETQLDFVAHRASRCHSLFYEDLAQAPESVLPPLFASLGEPWEPQVLNFANVPSNFGKEDNLVRGLKSFELSYGNWADLGEDRLRFALDRLGPLMTRLHYSPDARKPPRVCTLATI
jgi:hypothetical protein